MMMAVCFLTPIYTLSEKRPLISDYIKEPLVAAFRSPLMKALDRSVETLGLWIVTSSVTFIKSVNQSSIKPCQDLIPFQTTPNSWWIKLIIYKSDSHFWVIQLIVPQSLVWLETKLDPTQSSYITKCNFKSKNWWELFSRKSLKARRKKTEKACIRTLNQIE